MHLLLLKHQLGLLSVECRTASITLDFLLHFGMLNTMETQHFKTKTKTKTDTIAGSWPPFNFFPMNQVQHFLGHSDQGGEGGILSQSLPKQELALPVRMTELRQ